MKLLILTQKIDNNDDILGFMHRWVIEFARHWEKITVIALGVGEYHLPHNVRVLSLGKEALGFGIWDLGFLKKLKYTFNFFRYIWREKNNYDAVLVHMNQEYVILGGWLWRLLGKKVALWRNHQAGGFWVRPAIFFSNKVFCTSRFAFVARHRKNQLMPVGIDTDFFALDQEAPKSPRSVLFFSRISPIKRLDLLIEALRLLREEKSDFTAKIIGDAPARDAAYLEDNKRKVVAYGLSDRVEFQKGVPNCQAPAIYNQNEVFVNLTNSGSLDKTTMEAMACEQLVLVSNKVFNDIFSKEQKERMMFEEGNAHDLAEKIKALFALEAEAKRTLASQARKTVVERHSLKILAERLAEALGR